MNDHYKYNLIDLLVDRFIDRSTDRPSTYRPGELEGDDDLPSLVVAVRSALLASLKVKSISTENLGSFRAVRARSDRHDLGLVFLQAHSQVGVALVRAAVAFRRALLRLAAVAVEELPPGVVQRDQLQLEVTGGLTHLQGLGGETQGR